MSMFRILVVGFVAMTAACGSTEDERSSTQTTAVVPSTAAPSTAAPSSSVAPSSVMSSEPSSVLPSAVPDGGPECEGGLLPALAAIDQATGEFQWTYCSAELAWREVRGATDGIVYVDATTRDPSPSASMSGQPSAVIAVDATSGRELWRVAVARQKLGWPAGPFAGGGIVVVQVDDPAGPAIVGLNATTGETLWRVTEVELGATAPAHAPGPSAVAPLANTDDVVVLSVPTGLVGLDRASGRQIWSSDVLLLDESGVMAARGPAAVDGQTVMIPAASQFVSAYDSSGATVLVPTGGSALVAVDASTGAKLWQGPRLDHPTAAEGYVVGYVRSQGVPSAGPQARVIAVDVATGEQVWSKPGSESYGDLWAIGDGAVYVNDQSSNGPPDVVAYELQTGDERWRRSTSDSSVTHDPQRVADDAVVVLWEFLAVLSTTDGTTRWTVSGSQETPMSSVGHDAASIFVSFNSLPWMD